MKFQSNWINGCGMASKTDLFRLLSVFRVFVFFVFRYLFDFDLGAVFHPLPCCYFVPINVICTKRKEKEEKKKKEKNKNNK